MYPERNATMATVKVIEKVFVDTETQREVPYKRLAIIGYVGGEIHTLELKLSNTEMLMAEMLLNSKEVEPETIVRKANEQELDDFLDLNIGK